MEAFYILVEQGHLRPVQRSITRAHLDSMFQFKTVVNSYLTSCVLPIGGLVSCGPLPKLMVCPSTLQYVFRALSAPRPSTKPGPEPDAPRAAEQCVANVPTDEEAHLKTPDDELKREIMLVCAACGRDTPPSLITLVCADDLDLLLLCNHELPDRILPNSYNRDAYDGALLHPSGLTNVHGRDRLRICHDCLSALHGKPPRMPKYALANWLYYGHETLPSDIRQAFATATLSERLLVSRARASNICYKFSRMQGHPLEGTDDRLSQRCVKGNIAVHPQDSTRLNAVLPPSNIVIKDLVCAVFVGDKKPTRDTIEAFKPALVRKSKVKSMIDFLIAENPCYTFDDGFQGYSQRNMDELFGPGTAHIDQGILCAMEIGHVKVNDAMAGATASYVPNSDEPILNVDDMLIETVGYTEGDDTPLDYNVMSMKALSHCLRGGSFISSQAGSRFIPDFENPRLLSWLFPHLDPWGIGGFFEKRRGIPLTLDQQLKYLLTVHGSPFRDDPDFAFVYYNIRQKRAVFDSIAFRVPASQRDHIVTELLKVDVPTLERLISAYKVNPRYRPTTDDEVAISRLLTKVNTVSHDLPGSNGYKVMLRNQIRGLINYEGTPTLFLTLNPSDRDHPLVRLYADIARGEDLDWWRRTAFAAGKPSACARFFDQMISQFIKTILRHGGQKAATTRQDGIFRDLPRQGVPMAGVHNQM
ncbi:hypothetical protein GY45DRAFT_1349194 [Cubamyces sp. BRFM 1775]|nr:hypothetical protein GY45DRAFT_1349194 [Cubamyces sp. BRFM 1775]